MAGRLGRSGGHNRIPVEAHVLRGTFNATRHARRAAPGGPVWQPTPEDLARLGDAGREFVTRLQLVYEFSAIEGPLVLEGAIASDRLAKIRDGRGDVSAPARIELAWSKALANIILALRARL